MNQTILATLTTLVIGAAVLCSSAIAQDTPAPKPDVDKIAPVIKKEALWDGRKMAPFKSLDNPTMVAASEADYLDDSDYVLAIVVNGEARAYPTRFIWWHHVINDMGGKADKGGVVPFAMTYCSVCNTGIRYNATLGGKTMKLDFYGLYNGVVALCDRDTESVFLQAEGRYVKGPMTGQSLTMDSCLDTTWGEWRKLHPDSLVMAPKPPFEKRYSARGKPEPRGYDRFPLPFFKSSYTVGDLRIPPFDKMLGVFLPAAEIGKFNPRAYPMKSIDSAGGVINDMVDKVAVVAFLVKESQTANAFNATLDGNAYTFKPGGKGEFTDDQTGSTWSIEGSATAGRLMGKQLKRLDNHLSHWYGWAAAFPNTTIYGNTEPAKPGNPFADPK
ncbi:MAG: DUF3179 domain-containing (seleno)protein [Chthonomonadales bacterium]